MVTITGINFADLIAGPGAVTFGGFDATSYTLDSPTQITATTPAHLSGTVQVQVTAVGGPSLDTPGDNFTYIRILPPSHWSLRCMGRLAEALSSPSTEPASPA